MAKSDIPPGQLRRRTAVVARNDLRDVPQGTPGKVVLVNGFAWVRYWVKFDNGVYLGQINREDLATADEWKSHLAGEDVWGSASAATSGGDDGDGGDTGGGDGGSGGVTTPSGTVVPQKLIDRAKAARTRLAA